MTLVATGTRHTGAAHSVQHNDPCIEGSFKGGIIVIGMLFTMAMVEISKSHTESAANGSILMATIENSNADKIIFMAISTVFAAVMCRGARSNPLDAGNMLKVCTVIVMGSLLINGYLARSNTEVLADLRRGIVPENALVKYNGRVLPYKVAPHALRGFSAGSANHTA